MSAIKEKAYPWQLNWQQAEQHVPNRHLLKGFAPLLLPRERID